MRRSAVLAAILSMVVHHRRILYAAWAALGIAAVVCIGVFGLSVDTGRQNLVGEDDPDARRFRRFSELFGTTLNAVVVIESDDPAVNRSYADSLAGALRANAYVGSVFYRVSAEDFRRYALLYAAPDQLGRIRDALVGLKKLVTTPDEAFRVHGFVGLLGHANAFFARLEEGDTAGFASLDDADIDAAKAVKATERACAALREALTGPPLNELRMLKDAGVEELAAAGIDEEGYLSAKDGRLMFLFALPASADEQAATLTAFVDGIEGEASRLLPPGVTVGVTGYPAQIATETRLVVRDVWMTSVASFVGVVLLFLLLYGSAMLTVFMLVPLAAGVIVTLGCVSALNGGINMLSSAFFAFLVGLGVDFGIHLITRFNEARMAGASPAQAAEDTLIRTGPGVVTGAATTIAAFLALTASDFSGQVELGLLAAGGLLWVLLASLTLGPSLLLGHALRRQATDKPPIGFILPRAVQTILARLIHHKGAVLGGALALTVALAPAIRPLEFNFDVTRLLPADAPAVTAYEKLRENEVFSPDFAVLLTDSAASAREATLALNARPELVARVESAATYLPPQQADKLPLIAAIHQAQQELPRLEWAIPDHPDVEKLLQELDALAGYLEVDLPLTLRMHKRDSLLAVAASAAVELRKTITALRASPRERVNARLGELDAKLGAAVQDTLAYLARERHSMEPRDLPQTIRDAYWRQDAAGEHFAVRIYPRGDIADPEFMEDFRAFVSAIDPDITGLPITFLAWGHLFRKGMENAALIAIFFVVFLVWFDFRSITDTALALFPLGLGVLWMVGAMNVVGIEYNFANVIALPLIVGIGIDSGVHVLHRYREGTPPDQLPGTTGKAIGVSSATTILAFGTLAAAKHRGLETLGITLVLGVAGSLVAAALVLPALLQWLEDRKRRAHESTS